MAEQERASVLVRGARDVGSAVAAVLFRAGYGVALHDEPEPATPRRGMAFTDALFHRRAAEDFTRGRPDQSTSKAGGKDQNEAVDAASAEYRRISPFATGDKSLR